MRLIKAAILVMFLGWAGCESTEPMLTVDAAAVRDGAGRDALRREGSVQPFDGPTVVDASVEPDGKPTVDAAPKPDSKPGNMRNDQVTVPTFASTKNISKTIVITQAGVYDYQNVLHVWNGPGACNQQENQPYILRIAASNVTVKNFAYKNAPDGIHIGTANDGQGYNSGDSITNIVLDNVVGWACEDALTTQYGVQNVLIKNSLFLGNPNPNYRDKLLQLNFGDVTIENTTLMDTATCMMFKGSQHITVRNSRFINCDRGVNGSDHDGILGKIGTGPSTLTSEYNESYFAARAWQFWGGYRFLTGYGKISITSKGDRLFDSGLNDVRDGATLVLLP